MVEGASIDKAAHPNDITGVMSEMSSFDQSFQKQWNIETHKDTLVVANRPCYWWFINGIR